MKSVAAKDPTWEEVSHAIDEAINDLPDELRIPLIRSYLEGQRQEASAQELGVTHSAISKRLERATEALRQRLAKAGFKLSAAVLISLLTINAVDAAPATLTVTLGKVALAGAAEPAGVSTGVGDAEIVASEGRVTR